jgi:hypothetical protein
MGEGPGRTGTVIQEVIRIKKLDLAKLQKTFTEKRRGMSLVRRTVERVSSPA